MPPADCEFWPAMHKDDQGAVLRAGGQIEASVTMLLDGVFGGRDGWHSLSLVVLSASNVLVAVG